jgi:hypothetical protein
MISLSCYKHSDGTESEQVLNISFPVSVQGLLDAVKFAGGIKHPSIRLSAELTLFNETVRVMQLVRCKAFENEGWPVDPTEPAPMSTDERAAMILRLAQIGELQHFLHKEAAYNKTQETIRSSLCYQGIAGELMTVPLGFQGDAKFWYELGRNTIADISADFDSRKAAA